MQTLKNNLLEAVISPLGAELQGLIHVNHGNVLWRKNETHWNRISPILFPIVGRLINDQYNHLGKTYAMRQHGFARDQIFQVMDENQCSITYRLQENNTTLGHYPFAFTLDVCYTLQDNRIEVSHRITNRDNDVLLYSTGGHPGFHVSGKLENHTLYFDGQFTMDQHLITGNYYNGNTKKLRLNHAFPLSEDLFQSDAIVVKNPPFHSIGFGEKNGPKLLTVHCEDWTAVGLWTKPGAPFFCIEPWWGWADAWDTEGILVQKAGILSLPHGEIREHRYTIEIH